jgi:hypothetical protein
MKKGYPCTERDREIVAVVYRLLKAHIGKNHRITRNALRIEVAGELEMEFIGISDRDVRLAIEYLRTETVQGSLILSTSGNAGYWIAESLQELTQCVAEDRRRALSILVRIHKQKKVARKHFIAQENLPLFDFVNSIDDLELVK